MRAGPDQGNQVGAGYRASASLGGFNAFEYHRERRGRAVGAAGDRPVTV